MENKSNDKKIVIGIIICLVIAIISIVVYKKFYLKEEIVIKDNENSLVEEKNSTSKEKEVVLDKNDVTEWLENKPGLVMLFVNEKNNFDSSIATSEKYSSILGWYLLFGDTKENVSETKNIGPSSQTGYDYQYSYTKEYIDNLLNSLFGVNINALDIDKMNSSFTGYANFSMDANNFYVKVVATGLDNMTERELKDIYLNDNNEIVVEYNLYDCCSFQGNKGDFIEKRIIVLKQNDQGYQIIKTYGVS